MGDATRRLAGTLASQSKKAIDEGIHRHRHGTVVRVDPNAPKCDVLLNEGGDEVQGVDFTGAAPTVGDAVDVLVLADHGMRITGSRSRTATPAPVLLTPGSQPPTNPVIPIPLALGRLTLWGSQWLDIESSGSLPLDTTPPAPPSSFTIEDV